MNESVAAQHSCRKWEMRPIVMTLHRHTVSLVNDDACYGIDYDISVLNSTGRMGPALTEFLSLEHRLHHRHEPLALCDPLGLSCRRLFE
jgi:hypothetical protein